jgi:hypothetical protein
LRPAETTSFETAPDLTIARRSARVLLSITVALSEDF